MPITLFQREVLTVLARERSADNYVGGGTAINRDKDSPRSSSDLDFFHDEPGQGAWGQSWGDAWGKSWGDGVQSAAKRDVRVLKLHGFEVRWSDESPSHCRATVGKEGQELRLDWCHDSVFRFYPVIEDADFGYCLHPVDIATNKMLAMAGRSNVQDYVDVLYVHRTTMSLGALCWAASGKDPGFNPVSLLEMAKRHTRYRNEDLANAHLSQQLNVVDLKQHWLQAVDAAELLFDRLPAVEMGCLYLDAAGNAVTPDPDSPEFPKLVRHFGSVRGARPSVLGQEPCTK